MSFVPASFRRLLPSRASRSACRRISLALVGLLLVNVRPLAAQTPGTQDTSFNSVETGFTFYAQLLESINGTPVLFVGGDRDGLDELVASGLTPAGSSIAGTAYPGFGDSGIPPDFGNAGRIVYTSAPELTPRAGNTAPQILIGGEFGRSATQVINNSPGQNVIRLNPNGTIDTTFNPGKGANNYVTSLLPLADGGVVVGGEFDKFNQQAHLRLVRLDATGAIVSNSIFNSGLNFDATVLSLDAQLVNGTRNGQILVAGQFSNVNGGAYNKLARLNADGSVDASFRPNFDNRTTIVKSQPDGKILVGGDFEHVNGAAANHIVRLNYDGTVDPTFTASVTGMPSGLADPPAVYVIEQLSDGNMYLGGNFTKVNGVTRNYFAKVDATGALDPAFDTGKTIINAVQSLTVQPDGRLLVGETVSRALPGGKIYPPSLLRFFGETPTVTISTATEAVLTPAPTNGAFTLTRAGAGLASGPLTVYVLQSGHAKPNEDYSLAKLGLVPYSKVGPNGDTQTYAVTIPANQTSITLPVDLLRTKPFKKTDSKDVVLTVVNDQTGVTSYTIGQNAVATVTISNQ